MPIKEKFYIREGLVVNGDTTISGSVTTTVGFTGSLEGTASYSTTAQSIVGTVTSASYASTSSFIDSTFISASAAASGFGNGSGTVNSGNSSKLAYYASTGTAVSEANKLEYDGSNLKLTSTSQLDFYTNAGSIYFGNFSSPSYGRVGFSVPGQAVMVVDYSNARAGFGGGINLITGAPSGLVEIQGKANEIQLVVKGNGTQTANLTEWQNSGASVLAYVDPSGNVNGQYLNSNYTVGDEGGQIFLNKPVTNTSIVTGVNVDIYQDKLRFFEIGGTNRGAYIDIAACGAGVSTDIIGGLSDRRRKDNIMYLSYNHSNTINALKPAKFEFKENPGVVKHGFIAQDVLEVKPELVYGNGDQENGSYRLDYDGILAITVKSLQEALARITQLEQTIEELKK